jgi:enoyl-CoA hydratase/carnithine racemase
MRNFGVRCVLLLSLFSSFSPHLTALPSFRPHKLQTKNKLPNIKICYFFHVEQGLVLDELDHDPSANSSGFFPLLACLLDYPLPTIALLTGHTFGGACPFALAHDYRLMNSQRGYISMPPVNLGLHFPGIGSLLRLKLAPKTARKMLLEAHKWTGVEAEKEGIVDFVVEPGRMLEEALEWGRKVAPRARMGVFSLLRNELYGEAGRAFREISYVYGRRTGREAKAKI